MYDAISTKTKDIVCISMFATIIAICSWIYIPTTIPFTMQTFGVFCTLAILGGKRGTISILIYCALGAIGIPVFAGFSSGIGVLFGATGGYILGFIISGLIYWIITNLFGNKIWVMCVSMVLGLIGCYIIGTMWYMMVYAHNSGKIVIYNILTLCVFPFIIPDLIKIALAVLISKRFQKYVK